MNTKRLLGVLCIFLTGCAVGPDYERPELNIPEAYLEKAKVGEEKLSLNWWELFKDKELVGLIEHALKENKDLGAAMAKIDEARAMLGIAKADRFPNIGLGAGAKRIGTSARTFSYMPEYNDFDLGGNMSFELDLWGRVRRATEAQREMLMSSEYAYRALRLSLIAAVADTYFALIDLDNRVRIAEETVKNRKDATELIRSRFQGGVVPELDVNQAEIEEADTRVSLASLRRQQKITRNALSVLVGDYPYEIKRADRFEDMLTVRELPVGVPADLLSRRPDVMSAEANVHAQTALIGVAKAGQLPTISLTGLLGLEANKTEKLLNRHANTWNIASNLAMPVLDFGKSAYQVDAAEARAQQALKDYEKTVQTAVQEVDDAIVSIAEYKEEFTAWKAQLAAAKNASRLSHARYDDGVSTYLEVLDIERSLFQAQLGSSTTARAYLSSIVQLYKALGGGWEDPEPSEK